MNTEMFELNETDISVWVSPELFLNLYSDVYKFDTEIKVTKEIAFILSIIFMILGVVGNVSNWSLGRTAWKKEGPTTLLKEHQCVCERELRQMLVFLPFAVSP